MTTVPLDWQLSDKISELKGALEEVKGVKKREDVEFKDRRLKGREGMSTMTERERKERVKELAIKRYEKVRKDPKLWEEYKQKLKA